MPTANHYRVYALCALFTLVGLCALAPFISHAQAFKALTAPGSGQLGQLYSGQLGDLSGFINKLFKFAISLGAIGAVLRLAYAGYLYMGQSDMWSQKGAAKEIIKDVTLGLLLLLSIYLILFQINPDILTLKALRNIKEIRQTGPAAPSTSSGGGMPAGLEPSGLPSNPLDSTFLGAP